MTLRTLSLAAIFILAASASRAETIEFEVPDSTERLLVAIPDGWKEAHRKTDERQTIVEYIPAEQSLKSWEDMITVTVLRTPIPAPSGFAQNYSQIFITTFENSYCDRRFDPPTVIGGPRNNFPSAVYQFDCFTKPEAKAAAAGVLVRNYEMVGGIVIEGKHGLFHVQRAWHSDEFKVNERGEFLVPMHVVDKVLAARDAIHDFGVGGTTPCDTAAADRPCTTPPIAGQ
ncbi:MAG: hypothetical protein Q7V31_01825 [Parvibaculum sp.]|uniref:hypothetical protein n=1 Tax=Parvibaculum sp. TaxID=2024848 RepID=UPI00271644F7|nr:hypothetical protein [Parvibaculum sp.]MDO8837639.1 hypothetical protein [Parvibaculum sp.]